MEEKEWGTTNLVVRFPSTGTGSHSMADKSTALIFVFKPKKNEKKDLSHGASLGELLSG